MPNVVPRGLHARIGSTWKPPTNIYARVGGVWKQADYVWAYRNGTWQLIWGRLPAQPATATATWVQPATVRINWTAPPINTNTQWIVRRSDNSIVGTVPVGTLTITDPRPLLNNNVLTNSTIAAYTVEGSDGSTSSAKRSTNTVTFNLSPATQTPTVSYPNATTTTLKLSWTPNATYGRPQGWRVFSSSFGYQTDVLPGTTTTATITGLGRGFAANWQVIPFSQNPDGTWVIAGSAANLAVSFKATTPVSLSLTATNPPLSNLRLTWSSGGGTVTGYEVQTSTNGTTWAGSADDTSPSDWSTTVAGYMRVRALSGGGASDWAQAGPKTPINDTTGPVASTITSFVPESSYGRMVVRGAWSSSPDVATGQVYYRINNGAWVLSWGAAAINPSQAFTIVTNIASAGQEVDILIRTWDEAGNVGTDKTATYTLVASPINIAPSGDLSGTYRGGWRNDATRSLTEIATGWTGGGHNIGCYFYGTQIAAAIGAKTVVSASIQYWRENEGGLSAGVQPLFWTHNLTGRTAAPALGDQGVAEASRLGGAVARTGTTAASFALPSQFINALKSGSARGLAMYRGYQGSGDPDSYYMLMSIGGVVGGSPLVTNGLLQFSHLG